MAGRVPRPDNLALAIGVIVFTVFSLSLGDAMIKRIGGDFALWQIFVLRSVLAVPVLVAVMAWLWRAPLWPRHLGWTGLRSVLLIVMWVAYYAALPELALSSAAAAYYTLPLFITLFSALINREPVRPLGWIAVCLGFAGVLAILRPDARDFNAYALLPLGSAMLYALAMILTRTRCRDEHPLTLSLALNLGFIVTGALATGISALIGTDAGSFLWRDWSMMQATDWQVMAVLAAAILIGSIGAGIAYQTAPSSTVGTFDFAYVGFAVVWGLVFFGETPDALALLGIALIVAAGVLSIRSAPAQGGSQPHPTPKGRSQV